MRSRFGCCWLSEGLLRDPALGQGGHLNEVIDVHPLINIVEVRGGAGQGPSAASREDEECLQGDKDSPEQQLNESLQPQPEANAEGTESELFAEVFHQINDIILCWSSPIYTLSAPRQLCLNSDIQA